MTDIFLSYNREDQVVARLYADAFAAEGLDVWWDTALHSGEAYDEVTEAALRGAKAVVVLWSPRSVVSRWVRAEATVADRCKTLVPVTIEPCERPIMFELTQTADLSHWTGDSVDRAWLALVDDVRRMTAKAVRPDLETSASTVEPPTVEETLKPGQSGSAPSLAVLPFTNRSGLDEDEVFAVGMVEDVISALTQGVNVRVLGSMSTAHLRKSETADLSAVGRRLGVRYLLEGNVRRVGANLRVTTQLLEAASGEIAWTGKFDRPLTELASLQEELVTEVAASLDAQVNSLETERALRKPSDLTAWEAVTRSLSTLRRFDSEGLQRAIGEAARAVTIAPDYAAGHARLANTLGNAYFSLGTNDPAEVQRIRTIAERALSLGPDDALVLIFAGIALCSIGYPDEGVRHTSRAARKAPGSAMIHHIHGFALCFAGEPEKALSHIETATRLDSEAQAMWLMKGFQATALVALGRWTEAQTAVDECIALNPVYALSYVTKALVLDHGGKHGEALKQIELARGLGQQLERTERAFRGLCPKSPTLETNIAAIRALFVATEAGA